jgi:hypothetical protein
MVRASAAFPDLTVKTAEPSLTDGNLECTYVTLGGRMPPS